MDAKLRALALMGLAAGMLTACGSLPENLPIFVTPATTPPAAAGGQAAEGQKVADEGIAATAAPGAGATAAGGSRASGGRPTATGEGTRSSRPLTSTLRAGGAAGATRAVTGTTGATQAVTGTSAATTAITATTSAVTGTLGATTAVTGTAGASSAITATGATTATSGAAAARSASAASVGPNQPKPGDMLTLGEMARAEQLALGSDEVSALVAEAVDRDAVIESAAARGDDAAEALADLGSDPSFRVIYTQRHPDKNAESRAADVAIYRYDTREFSVSTVDLATGVIKSSQVIEDMPAPIIPAEIAEAAAIARADAGVRAALTAAGLDPDTATANALLTVARDSEAQCAIHRCLRLFFSSLRQPVPKFSVVVDQSNLAVAEIQAMPKGESNP